MDGGGGGGLGSTACLMHSPYGLFISRPQCRRHLIRMQVSAGADRRGIGGGGSAAGKIERLLPPPPISLFRPAPRPQNAARRSLARPHCHLTWRCKRFFSEA